MTSTMPSSFLRNPTWLPCFLVAYLEIHSFNFIITHSRFYSLTPSLLNPSKDKSKSQLLCSNSICITYLRRYWFTQNQIRLTIGFNQLFHYFLYIFYCYLSITLRKFRVLATRGRY